SSETSSRSMRTRSRAAMIVISSAPPTVAAAAVAVVAAAAAGTVAAAAAEEEAAADVAAVAAADAAADAEEVVEAADAATDPPRRSDTQLDSTRSESQGVRERARARESQKLARTFVRASFSFAGGGSNVSWRGGRRDEEACERASR